MIRRRRRRTRSIRGTGEADRSRGRLPRWEPAPPELRPPASCGSPRRRARSERKPQHCEELGPPALDPRTRRRLGREPTPLLGEEHVESGWRAAPPAAWSLRLGKEEPTIQGDRRGCAVGRISGKMARKKQKRCAEKDERQGRDKGWHRWDPLMGDVSMPCVGAWVLPRGWRRVGQKYRRPTKSHYPFFWTDMDRFVRRSKLGSGRRLERLYRQTDKLCLIPRIAFFVGIFFQI